MIIRFVILVVFVINYNGVNYCLTQLYGGEMYIYIYILLLYREKLHISALGNGHLQIAYESVIKHLYKHIYMGYLYGEGGVGGGG